ncbi:MAG: tRNA dihydrouridine synthase DusB [Deltaproteobacteria bacterium]|nr:tRNA dihydrouridine synthase DusB [Deltaproteobacteria bacterium]
MKIGSREIERCHYGFATLLAPMANVTNAPFRAVALAHQCGLTVSEMVSSEHLLTGGVAGLNALRMERTLGAKNQVIQLLGGDPSRMAEAALVAESEGADVIDINMGCPIRRIAHGCDSGVALMRDPARAAAIVRAMVGAVKVPVTVKIRAGWDDQSINAVELARVLEASGAAMLTVHARTAGAVYSGPARLGVIAEVKRAVGVPVVGNGGVNSAEDAVIMARETGCDGVMIGRGALGNPWIFASLAQGIACVPTLAERVTVAVSYVDALIAHVGEGKATREVRKNLRWFFAGTELEGAVRKLLPACDSRARIVTALATALENPASDV